MFTSFETSARALRAQQRGLDVTSNNIANVNTPGYTRQEVILSQSDPMHLPQMSIGTGVFANDIKNYRENWLDAQMRGSLSQQAGYSHDNKIFLQIQNTLNEPSDAGLDSAMSKFYSSVEQLSNKPDDVSLRSTVLSSASNLASTFNNVGSGLTGLRRQVYSQLDANVTQVNRLLSGIAELNNTISSTRSNDGESSSTLQDKQNVLIEQLAKLGDVQVSHASNGSVNVSMNGTTVVVNDSAMKMKLQSSTDATTGEMTASIAVVDPHDNQVGVYKPATGEMASQMKYYNVTLDDKDTSGGFSIAKSIDTLANAFASKINAVSQTGYGLDDVGPTPPGRDIFGSNPPGNPVTASNITVNPALLADPRLIPSSSVAGESGNNDVLRKIGQLANDASFVGNQTSAEFYGATLTTLANIGADSANGQAVADATVNQVSTQRDSVVGVNIDEEAINMIKFQRAFEAAARMVTTTSEMMKTVVNLGL